MAAVNAVSVCVGYDDLLAITLPALLPHVADYVVVTSPDDRRTQELVARYPGARCHLTDVFTRGGAKFNKGAGLEEGFDALGREGWALVIDADIYVPPDLSTQIERLNPRVGCLYTPRRRILPEPKLWERYSAAAESWRSLVLRKEDKGFYGYFQLFHASDPAIRRLPWYPVDVTHAGLCDDEFQRRWNPAKKVRPTFEVLHLGKCDENWFGRASDRIDGESVEGDVQGRRATVEKFHRMKGWRGFKADPTAKVEERIG